MSVCESARCEFGWVVVTEDYVTRNAPEPDLPDGEGPELDAERARLVLEWKCRVAALRNTVYPCPKCNTRLFFAWRDGHLEADHDREECDVCVAPGQRGGGTTRRGNPEPVMAGVPIPNPPPMGYKDPEMF